MKRSLTSLAGAFAFLALAGSPAGAQTAARKAIPRAADGKPDFSGVWAGPGFTHRVGPNDTDTPSVTNFDPKNWAPFKPGGEELFLHKLTGDERHDDPTAYCLPDGFPREALSPYATQILQQPGTVTFLYEYMHFFRVVPTDGRPHPKDVDLTFMGDAVGKWDGDTLVVDTIGLRPWPIDAFTTGFVRYHSDALHVIERFQYTDPTTVALEMTIDDPKIFTKPWSQNFQMKLHPTWKLFEQICEENNRCQVGHCEAADVQKTPK
jgi:hypothetical protein